VRGSQRVEVRGQRIVLRARVVERVDALPMCLRALRTPVNSPYSARWSSRCSSSQPRTSATAGGRRCVP
jgi:hypothetical protein